MNTDDIPFQKRKIYTTDAVESSKKKRRIVDDTNGTEEDQDSMGTEVIDSMSMNKKELLEKTKEVLPRPDDSDGLFHCPFSRKRGSTKHPCAFKARKLKATVCYMVVFMLNLDWNPSSFDQICRSINTRLAAIPITPQRTPGRL